MNGPLTDDEMQMLATYNAEVYRGIIHRGDYDERMAELQAKFDAGEHLYEGYHIAAGSGRRTHFWRVIR